LCVRAFAPARYHRAMRILLVEDDAVLLDVMLRRLREEGHRVD